VSLIEKALLKVQSGDLVKGQSRNDSVTVGTGNESIPSKGGENKETDLPVELSLDALPIVKIDKEKLKALGILAQGDQERVATRQFREIKRSLLGKLNELESEQHQSLQKVVMLTSALPGDGKTFTTLNLALNLALEKDITVILVDGDVAKPHISTLLNCTDSRGLLDFVSDASVALKDIIYKTNVPRLYFIPAGEKTEQANELMSGSRMKEVLSQLASIQKNCLIVFDTSPVLLTSESKVMLSYSDFVILMIKAGMTPKIAVVDSMKILNEMSVKFGVVLNDVKTNVFTSYGYGYGYGYGSNRSQGSGG
jgi:protein-tyrosine kinase